MTIRPKKISLAVIYLLSSHLVWGQEYAVMQPVHAAVKAAASNPDSVVVATPADLKAQMSAPSVNSAAAPTKAQQDSDVPATPTPNAPTAKSTNPKPATPTTVAAPADANGAGAPAVAMDQRLVSNAFNYSSSLSVGVSDQTGVVTLDNQIAKIPGKNGLDVDITLKYLQGYVPPVNSPMSQFGLGNGWTFNIPYIDFTAKGAPNANAAIYLDDGSQYPISCSGIGTCQIINYQLQNMTLESVANPQGGVEYVLTKTVGGTQYIFDRYGKITNIKDRFGNTLTYSYTNGKLSQIVDTYQQSIVFHYTGNMLSSITLPDGRAFTFTVGADGNLASITDPMKDTTSFSYKDSVDPSSFPGYPHVVTSSLGSVTNVHYKALPNTCFPMPLAVVSEIDTSVQTPVLNSQGVVLSTGVSQGRTVYQYSSTDNPIPGTTNYTGSAWGSPSHCSTTQDGLLASNDNNYFYTVTETHYPSDNDVENGLKASRVVKTYNHLHLQVKEDNYAEQHAGQADFIPVSSNWVYYGGQEQEAGQPSGDPTQGAVPVYKYDPQTGGLMYDPATGLPANNYQAPIRKDEIYYDYLGHPGSTSVKRTETNTYQYDDHGQVVETTDPLKTSTYTTYDYANYGLPIAKVVVGDTSQPASVQQFPRVTWFTETNDGGNQHLNIAAEHDGYCTVKAPANPIGQCLSSQANVAPANYSAMKQTDFAYDMNSQDPGYGQLTQNILHWADGAQHDGVNQTQQNITKSFVSTMPAPGGGSQPLPGNHQGIKTITTDADGAQTIEIADLTNGEIVYQQDPVGNATYITYDQLGRVSTKTLPNGTHETMTYVQGGSLGFNSMTVSYDDGYQQQELYDSVGRSIVELDNAPLDINAAANSPLPSSYDENGVQGFKALSYTHYNSNAQKDFDKNVLNQQTTQYLYNLVGEQTDTIGADGIDQHTDVDHYNNRKVSYTIGNDGSTPSLKTVEQYNTTNSQLSNANLYAANNSNFNLLDDATPMVVENHNYDALGQEYNDVKTYGNVPVPLANHKVGGPLTSQKTTTFDPLGQVTSEEVAADDPASENMTSTYTYDLLKNQVRKQLTHTFTNTDGNIGTQAVFGDYHVYDATGKLLAEIDASGLDSKTGEPLSNSISNLPVGSAEQYTYFKDGKQQSYVAKDGMKFSYQYDNMGHQTDSSYGTGDMETLYSRTGTSNSFDISHVKQDYDPTTGNLLAVYYVDANGKQYDKIQYAYYLDGSVESVTYPDGKSFVYSYNPVTGTDTVTDAAGVTTTYQYALSNTQFPGVNAGALASVTSSAGPSVKYTYDVLGHIKTETLGNGMTTTYTYDDPVKGTGTWDLTGIKISNNGNVVNTFSYIYDNKENVQQVIATTPSNSDQIYNNLKQYTYDAYNRVTETDEYDVTGNNLISKTLYSFDVLGNVTEVKTEDANNKVLTDVTYTYNDGLDGKAIDAANPYNALLSITSTDPNVPSGTFSYDLGHNGNMTKDNEGNLYAYNERDQLISFTSKADGTTTYYSYSPDGLRQSKTQVNKDGSNVTIGFYYENLPGNNDGIPVLLNETSNEKAGETLMSSYLLGANNERLTRMILGFSPTSDTPNVDSISYYVSNVRKDVTGTVDSSGKVTPYAYSDYGVVLKPASAKATNAAAVPSTNQSK